MSNIAPEMTKEHVVQDHEKYPDIWENGLENYPFAQSRIAPVIYEIPDGSKVLDVGCNSGELIKYLKDKKNCDVTGVDVSAPMVEKCKAKGLNVLLCDADRLPFENGIFDVVVLCEVLEHFHDPVTYLKEIKRVLKPSGFLIGTCPHANLERYIWSDQRLHHQYYTEEGIKRDFDQVFDKHYLRVLTGAQFNMGMATSFLANEPAEILFKCGESTLQPWETILKESKSLRAWFGWTQLSGDVYYRMRGYADKMRDNGLDIAYEDFEYNGSEFQMQWQGSIRNRFVMNKLEDILKIADLSVWQLVANMSCLAFLRCAKDLIKKPMITEIDDWILDLPAYNIASNPYRPNSEPEWVCTEQMRLSDAFIVSTSYIKERILEMFPGKPVHVIPNSIDFKIWDNLKPVEMAEHAKKPGMIRIGYTGCGNHDGDMELIKRPIAKILEEFPNVEFVTSHPFPTWSDIKSDRFINLNRWVLIDKYPNEVAGWKADIFVAPLRDNMFNRGKSNLRWLESSALKVPIVTSRIRPFKESITEGEDGLMASSEKEWYDQLKSLIVDEQKRVHLGETAYANVKRDFDMDEIAKQYGKILEEIKWTAQRSTQKLAAS
jgi:SAM-dependent methyltransferase/glycosyltransferase involved in cell wall biosynthesis